jgi:hypothetical protein
MAKPVPILRDTREKKPWDFSKDKYFDGQKDVALKTGDYSLEGYEDDIVVERKKDVNELIANFTTDKRRIYDEVERLKKFRFAAIVVEQNLAEVLNSENYYVARKFKNRNAPVAIVINNLLTIMMQHGIHVIFAGCKGKSITRGILVRARELCNAGKI